MALARDALQHSRIADPVVEQRLGDGDAVDPVIAKAEVAVKAKAHSQSLM